MARFASSTAHEGEKFTMFRQQKQHQQSPLVQSALLTEKNFPLLG